jgi:anti-sigma B factor antagonist
MIESITRQVGDITVVDLVGTLTGEESKERLVGAVEKLLQSERKRIVINFSDVRYMDVNGLAAVVLTFTKTSRVGGRLVLTSINTRVQNLLSITKLINIFETYSCEEEAVKSFGS